MTESEFQRLHTGDRVRLKMDITAALEAEINELCALRLAGKSVTIKKMRERYIQIEESIISWWFPMEFIECAEEKQTV